MADLDRAGLIELLGRLGAGSDEMALAAARELDRTVKQSGLTWDALLRADDGEIAVPAAPAPQEAIGRTAASAGRGDDVRIIDRLLARKDISDTLRADLNDFKRQIAEGKLEREDADYIRAVAKRLGA